MVASVDGRLMLWGVTGFGMGSGCSADMVKFEADGSESAEAPSGPVGPAGKENEGTELRDIMLPLQRT